MCGNEKLKDRPDYARYLSLSDSSCGIAQCTECGLTMLSPRPSSETLKEFWDTGRNVFGLFAEQDDSGILRSAEPSFQNLPSNVDRRLQIINKHRSSGKILDVGPGRGHFLNRAKQQGYHVTGIEPGEHNRQWAREHFDLEFLADDVESYKPDELFDIVHCRYVLHHLWSPSSAIKRMAAWTKPGGYCVLEEPNPLKNIFAVTNRLIGRLPQRATELRDVIRTVFFDPKSLSDLCNRNGFNAVEAGTWYLPGAGAEPWRLDYWSIRLLGNFLSQGADIYVVARKT